MPVANSRRAIQNRQHIAITGLTALTALLFGLPVLLGLIGIILPASGYFPALGQTGFSGDAARHFLATPGLGLASWLSLKTGLMASAVSLAGCFIILAAFSGSRVSVKGAWPIHVAPSPPIWVKVSVPRSGIQVAI